MCCGTKAKLLPLPQYNRFDTTFLSVNKKKNLWVDILLKSGNRDTVEEQTG